jgi:ribosomal-protein-alanine N-acetyltransferase
MNTPSISFPVLLTERLILRRMKDEDVDDLFNMRKDPEMHEYTDTMPDQSIRDTTAYMEKMDKGVEEGKWLLWAMESRLTGKVIGSLGIWNFNDTKTTAEMGYGIIPQEQGKGYMTEALKAVLEFCFKKLGMEWIEAYTDEDNNKSTNMLERLGFIEVNRVIDQGYNKERLYNMIVFRKGK